LTALRQGEAFVPPPSPRGERQGSARRNRLRPSALSVSSSAADFTEGSDSPSSAGHSRQPTRVDEEDLPSDGGR